MPNENAETQQNASNLFECPICGECYTTAAAAEECRKQHHRETSMELNKYERELHPELQPTPASFWQLLEVNKDGEEIPCKDMPQAYPQPDDLMPALKSLLAQDRNIHIRPASFTIAMAAVTLFNKAMTTIHIQLATGWPNETMREIEKVAAVIYFDIGYDPEKGTAATPIDQANLLLSNHSHEDDILWGETNADS